MEPALLWDSGGLYLTMEWENVCHGRINHGRVGVGFCFYEFGWNCEIGGTILVDLCKKMVKQPKPKYNQAPNTT